MRIPTTVRVPTMLAMAGLLFGSGAASGQFAPSGGAAVPTTEQVRVGMATDDPEQDSLGLAAAPPTACLVTRFSERPQPVGTLIGDSEKDSFGFVVLGTEPCPTASPLR